MFNVSIAFSQNIVKGFVVDSKSKQPLEYVIVSTKQGDVGVYTNEKGYFELSIPSNIDSVIISLVGFKREMIAIDKLSKPNIVETIQLIQVNFQLPELTVKSSNKTRISQIGYINSKQNKIYIPGSSKGGIRAVFIANENDDDVFIKELIYRFHSSWQEKEAIIRVHLYKVNPYSMDKEPGEELLPQSIIIKFNKTSKLKVDISKYAIKFPDEGVYVGLEWIEGKITNKRLNFHEDWLAPVLQSTNDYPSSYTWTTQMTKSWDKSIKSANHHSNPSNVMFGLTIIK